MNPSATANGVAEIFFPQSRSLGLQVNELQSPAVLQKMIQAGTRCRSYPDASRELHESAELSIDAKTIERAVHRIGKERADQRDAAVEQWKKLPLPEQQRGCPQPKAPKVAVVQFDCGRILVRERKTAADRPVSAVSAGSTAPAESSESEVHSEERQEAAALAAAAVCAAERGDEKASTAPDPAAGTATVEDCRSQFWRDSKVGVLLTMHSEELIYDPCPEIPPSFLQLDRIVNLVRGMGHCPSLESDAPQTGPPQEGEPAATAPTADESAAPGKKSKTRPGQPIPLVKTILSSRACSALFGAMLAAAAWARGFSAATRKAFVADGASMNWTLWQRFFSHYVPILDFIHALQYVFAAAMAGHSREVGWQLYRQWIQAVWAGQVEQVIEELQRRQRELGEAPKNASFSDPRRIVATTLGYLQTHRSRMDYARYRRLGLPLMSSYVESAVKQINQRVKGTEKFWCEAGGEAILQLRGDYLSDTQPLSKFWQQRQLDATGQRCYSYACAP
jgi:hypothetical protein